jgi:chromodomain-helicase-DNA-binding protein 1
VYRATASDSESDGYVNAKKNIPTKKERQRLLLVAEGRLPPSRNEVRFSARRTAQVTNYNEEEEDSFEEDEEETTPNYWAGTTEENAGPTIDKILDHRPKEGTGNGTRNNFSSYTKQDTELDPFYAGKQDFEYLVNTPHTSMHHIDLTNAID